MHALNCRMPASRTGTSAAGYWSLVPAGSRRWQPFSAAWYWELLTPSCCAVGNFALVAPASGSGKFGTPFERMHWEKARSEGLAAPAALGELLEPVDEAPGPRDDGLALHAASGTRAAAAMMTA